MRFCLLALIFGVAAAGCCGPVAGLYPPREAEQTTEIFIYNNHWHTGFVVPTTQLSPTLKRYLSRFGEDTRFIEIGWGDEGFYRAPHGTSGLAFRAMFFSRGSVLHIAGLAKEPPLHYRDFVVDLYRIRISEEGTRRLMRHLERTFATTESGDAIELGPGLYGVSYFYRGRGWYNLFHNCNNWLADGLRATGFPISPIYTATAENVGWQIRLRGQEFQPDTFVQRQ